jgi:hypothetical protein
VAINVFTKLQRLLADPKTNFFPTSAILPQVGGGGLPLLDLINDSKTPTPKLPLTISALRSLVTSLGPDDLMTLDANLLNLIKSGSPVDALEAIVDIPRELQGLAAQVENLLVHQLVIGASLFSIIAALDPKNEHKSVQFRIRRSWPILFQRQGIYNCRGPEYLTARSVDGISANNHFTKDGGALCARSNASWIRGGGQ